MITTCNLHEYDKTSSECTVCESGGNKPNATLVMAIDGKVYEVAFGLEFRANLNIDARGFLSTPEDEWVEIGYPDLADLDPEDAVLGIEKIASEALRVLAGLDYDEYAIGIARCEGCEFHADDMADPEYVERLRAENGIEGKIELPCTLWVENEYA